jgi:hypothetical protein
MDRTILSASITSQTNFSASFTKPRCDEPLLRQEEELSDQMLATVYQL